MIFQKLEICCLQRMYNFYDNFCIKTASIFNQMLLTTEISQILTFIQILQIYFYTKYSSIIIQHKFSRTFYDEISVIKSIFRRNDTL